MSVVINIDERQKQWTKIFAGEHFRNAIGSVLPRQITVERFARVVLGSFQATPKLLECTGESILYALLSAAQFGLEPDGGPLGHGWLLPFYNNEKKKMECKFIPGYRGLMKLARNSGEVVDISAEVVYEADKFSYTSGLNPTLEHVRADNTDKPGKITHAYAVARFRDGEKKFTVLNRRELDQIQATSKSAASGPWKTWPGEMSKKTAVRRLCKMLPLSPEIQTKIQNDELLTHPGLAVVGSLVNAPDVQSLVGAEVLEHEAEVVEPTAEQLVSMATLDEFVIAVEGCKAQGEPTALYDSWFGPERKREWTLEEDEKARACVNAKEESLKPQRGLKSNKQAELVK